MLISQFQALYRNEGLSSDVVNVFRNIVYEYYKKYGREFPFRSDVTPYNVLVSEMMLQQTQTGRVSEKFLKFKKEFPDFESLSNAPLEDVLKAWQGLGYNRRAVALKKIAGIVINEYDGRLPESVELLEKLPNIGHNTASSIVAFAFNKPVTFIETNIRRVYIHFFFPGKRAIADNEILPLIEATADGENSRKWYYALMDFGVMLKKRFPELNKRSAHYKKQAPFKGSNRQIRGKILKKLVSTPSLTKDALLSLLKIEDEKLITILDQLEKEGFISNLDGKISIKKTES